MTAVLTRPGQLAPVLLAPCLLLSGCWGIHQILPGARVSLRFEHLLPIQSRYGHYAAWAMGPSAPVKLGDFAVDAQEHLTAPDGGPLKPLTLPVPGFQASRIFITQELPGAAEKAPSKQVFLEGAYQDGRATLAAPVQPDAYAKSTGLYLLDNPETPADPSDFNGIWFAGFVSRRFVPGLDIPESPDGWMYEGWTILNGIPLRMGKFRSGTENVDWNGYSGRTGATPLLNPAGAPMPGQDFNANLPPGIETGPNKPALDGATVIISLENATLANEEQYPSPIRLFEASVPDRPVMNVPYPLQNVAASDIPSGVATVD